jgi:adenylosuccinate lyase
MIPRYSRKEIRKIWEPENKFKIWLDIEIAICEALEKIGVIPKSALENIKTNSSFNISRIDQIEKEVKHDVIAFLTNIAENVGADSKFIHMGVTSSDIIDTALSIQLKQSSKIIKKELEYLIEMLEVRAKEHKLTPCIGRSHGIFAEPTTFGLKLLGKYCEFKRHLKRLNFVEKEISICSISGAVGTFANIAPYVESYVAKKLKLQIESISTQIIPRDRHASFFSCLALIASSIENLAIEIRHLQRSEVREVEEYFSQNQKGSSAMPHKRNPILSENLTGLARVIRSSAIPFMENIALWHERDISHSSVERTIGPDSIVLMDFALSRLSSVVKNLVVDKKMMLKNLEKTNGLYNSQRVMLKLIEKGEFSREEAYKIVQNLAMESWKKDKNFKNIVKKNKKISNTLNKKEIENIFDIKYHLKNIDQMFERVLNEK